MMADENYTNQYLSTRSWARRWDCSSATIRRIVNRYGVERVWVGDGLVRYRLSDIRRIEAERGVGDPSANCVPDSGAATEAIVE